MASEAEAREWMIQRLNDWCERNNSIVIPTPEGKLYALFFEPDGEHPHMRYMGHGLNQAYRFIVNHHTNVEHTR